MLGGLFRCALLQRAFAPRDAFLMPGLPGRRRRASGRAGKIGGGVPPDVSIRARVSGLRTICSNGVVHVEGDLSPRIEHYLLVGVVGEQDGDDALNRIIEKDGTDTDLHAEFEAMSVGEVGLVL